MNGVKNAAIKVGTAAVKAAMNMEGTARSARSLNAEIGSNKTTGFRGWMTGYGKVPLTELHPETGAVRALSMEERVNARQLNRMNMANRMMGVQMAAMALPMVAGAYAAKNPESGIAKNMEIGRAHV